MDEINKTGSIAAEESGRRYFRPAASNRRLIMPLAAPLVLGLLAIWLSRQQALPPLDLQHKPALLFFNNQDGCSCAVAVYRRADAEIAAWEPAERHYLSIVRLDLDARPDLQTQYRIVRAPTLLLVDAAGREMHRQDEVISDELVFNLPAFERAIESLEADFQ